MCYLRTRLFVLLVVKLLFVAYLTSTVRPLSHLSVDILRTARFIAIPAAIA